MKNIYLFLFSFLAIISQAYADGTKQLMPDSTQPVVFDMNNSNTGTFFAKYNSDSTCRLYIEIKNPATEKIHYGFGKQFRNEGGGSVPATSSAAIYYRIKNPSGTIVFGPALIPNTGKGFITSYRRDTAGPLSVVGAAGYRDSTYKPLVAGKYYIEFNLGSATVQAPYSGSDPNESWKLALLDISVSNTTTNKIIPGRVWCREWGLSALIGSRNVFSKFKVYTKDSIVTELNLNGVQPIGFSIFCNSTGPNNTGNIPIDRKSINSLSSRPEYRIFFTNPDSTIFPKPNDLSFSTAANISGCPSTGYCISVYVSKPSYSYITIDLNGTPGFQLGTADVRIFASLVAGQNCVNWNGRNGLGVLLSSGSFTVLLVDVLAGITHFPIRDAENNPNGFRVNIIRPVFPNPRMYWDDLLIGGSVDTIAGCSPACHSWGSNFGDNRTVNTWWYSFSKQNIQNYTISNTCPWETTKDGDFNNPTTWLPGTIPPPDVTVIIKHNVTLTAADTVGEIEIRNTGILHLTNKTINVMGDINVAGILDGAQGIVNFNGTGNKEFFLSTPTYIKDINLNGSTSSTNLTISGIGGLNIIGTVNISTGTFNTGDVVTFYSDATGTGRLGPITGTNQFLGKITMQRFIPTICRFRYLGTCVSGTKVSDWQDDFPITGLFTGATSGSCITSSWVSMYRNSESSFNVTSRGWLAHPASSNSESLNIGQGYVTHMRQRFSGCVVTPFTNIDVFGTPTVGTFNFTVTRNGIGADNLRGWNLLANPYPSQINGDIGGTGWTRNNIDRQVSIWDATANSNTGGYVTYINGVGTGGFNGVINSSQAFFVHATGASAWSLSSNENVKTSSTGSFYRTASIENILRVAINDSLKHGDDIAILLRDNSSLGFDNDYEAYSLKGYFVQLATKINNGDLMSIMAHPLMSKPDTIPLIINEPIKGTHKLSFTEGSSFIDNIDVVLIDQKLNQKYDLRNDIKIEFKTTSDSSTFKNRFIVIINNNNALLNIDKNIEKTIKIYPNPIINGFFKINTKGINETNVNISIRDILGKVVIKSKIDLLDNYDNILDIKNRLSKGMYIIDIQTNTDKFTQKIIVQ